MEIENPRDFILARAAVARSCASRVIDLVDDLVSSLMDGEITKLESLESIEDAIDESGFLSRYLEVAKYATEQAEESSFREAEPDYEEIVGDASEEGESDESTENE